MCQVNYCLEKASVEEEADLQEKWAALLANAAIDESSVLPAYPHILGSLSRLDAKVLRNLARSGSTSKPILVQNLDPKYHTYEHDGPLLEAQYQVRLENLHRMGLVYPIMLPYQRGYEGEEGVIIPTSGKVQYKNVGITELGRAFLIACTPPEQQHLYQKTDK
jgi:hypothetical protein